MKKSELIAALTEKSGLTKPQAAAAISALTEIITEVGKSQDSLTLTGFGTFKGKTRPAGVARNPSTGAQIEVAEKRILTFKPSSGLNL
jgi:nucleoid DNA-binding protein